MFPFYKYAYYYFFYNYHYCMFISYNNNCLRETHFVNQPEKLLSSK